MTDRIIVFDTETDSLDTGKANLLEMAFQVVDIAGTEIGELMNTFVAFEGLIPAEITAINRITNKDLIGAPTPSKVVAVMEKHCTHYGVKGILAHNIWYDLGVMDKYVSKNSPIRKLEIIDSLRLSRRLFPDSPAHKLGVLCEHLGLESESFIGEFHSAGYDVAMTVELVKTMVDKNRFQISEIIEGVNVLASSASEIMAAVSQLASSAAETATSVGETTTTVEEVKQTAEVSNEKATGVSENSQKPGT